MDNTTVRIAVGLRLGAPIVRPHKCVCGTEVAVNGHHGLVAQDDIHAPIKSARYFVVHLTSPVHATREPHSLCGRNDKRPAGATQIPWKRAVVWLGTPSPAPTHMHSRICNPTAGRTVQQQQEQK